MSYRGKVILCGDAGVGKTSLLAQYVDGKFSEKYQQTIGANFLIKEMVLNKIIEKLELNNPNLKEDIKKKGFKLYFWDLGGQKHALFANEYYFVQAVGAMVIFSLSNVSSFENLDFWISKLKELSGTIPFVIIGNKSDLKREITQQMIDDKLKNIKVQYFETSAKLNENVDNVFQSLSVQILNTLK